MGYLLFDSLSLFVFLAPTLYNIRISPTKELKLPARIRNITLETVENVFEDMSQTYEADLPCHDC